MLYCHVMLEIVRLQILSCRVGAGIKVRFGIGVGVRVGIWIFLWGGQKKGLEYLKTDCDDCDI